MAEKIEIYGDKKEAKARVAELGLEWIQSHGISAVCVTIRPDDEMDCTETRMAQEMGLDPASQNIYAVYPDRV